MKRSSRNSNDVMERIRFSMKDVKLNDSRVSANARQSSIRNSKVKFFETIQKRSFDNLSITESKVEEVKSDSFTCSSDSVPSINSDGTDLNALIEDKVKKFTDDSFIYLKYTVSRTSEYFTPYSLQVCKFDGVNKNGLYYTMSRHGVTLWSPTESFFTDLNQWQKEYQMYCKIMRIKLFAQFRLWKGFKVYEKTVRWAKYNQARMYIQDNLFFVIPSLALCVVRLKTEITALMDSNFVDVSLIEEWHPFYFLEVQMKIYETLRVTLRKFREVAKKYIYEACYKAIVDRGFFPTDEIDFYPSAKKMRDSMSSMDRARKRRFCKLLSNFLSLCDHMMLTLLHNIVRNTFYDLKEALRLHDECAPTLEDLENLNLDAEIEPRRSSEVPQNPFFLAELILRPDKVEVDPSEEVMQHIFNQLTNLIQDFLMGIDRFTSDPYYKIFTEPSIMGRQEDRLSGAPPDFDGLLWVDLEYRKNRRMIPKIVARAYNLASVYMKRFETIRKNYHEDVTTDPNILRQERDLIELRKYCERYHNNVEALEGILPSVNLGLLKLKQGSFKEIVTPVCQDLFNVLVNYLPKLATEEVDKIYEKAIDLMGRITEEPTTTIAWVNYLRNLNKLGDDFEALFLEVDYAHDVFIIIKDFSIFINDEDKDKYLDTEDLVIGCKDTLTEKQDEREEFIKRLDAVMQIDIEEISKDIHEIAVEIVDFKYLDKKSDPDIIKKQLDDLMERLLASQEKVLELRNYQKEFRIDITKYEELDFTLQEIRLRQNLWKSIDEWNTALESWNTMDFHSLNMEELLSLNSKILKNCMQFEKYLPANELVPVMKESAEIFKEKLPVIGYLRNNSFKPRHWSQIEGILNTKVIQDDAIHIADFETAGAFSEDVAVQLMEISSQASGEAQLENMLKALEGVWKETELSIVSHHDSKDVFVLAGSDELQAVLDDSNININTIAASKFVGPIRPKVNEWIRLMDLFGKTLDEWLTCQTSWIYLEAIFSSPDIQRQLPLEAKMFIQVDKNFKKLMRNAHKTSLALPIMADMDNYNTMRENNEMLEKITRSLEAYLEVKRVVFPRFYFLSNDELLEILAQTRVPQAVQPHLRKCFDAISKLEFGVKDMGEGGVITTNDIIAMISPEGEKLLFGKGLKARGPVEEWLSKVEEAMFLATKRYMKFGYQCYPAKDRADWFQEHPNQVVLTVSQQQWATDIHAIIDNQEIDKAVALKKFEIKCLGNLSALAAITRMDISSLLRKVLCALITIDVHAKDSVVNLNEKQVASSLDFNWLKMLRFYWDSNTETMTARMASANLPYYYEYLGAGGVLVLTPLTDRCYLCLMGALQMDLGGAPAGPAGTGKTETTKDLAKSLAKQCVVFNCSEGLDYKMMGRFFSGLAQCGAWCCFDEFNRIDIEVLSVIAQQLITIRNAKVARQKRFMFEGREIKLIWSCAVFITMNPGYAGRTELPDNLKALFRPISMMVPDYALISEVILYSEGFEDPKILAHKMVQMYKLCSEQLSQQNHYDFGMRAVKSVLVMAGSLKRSAPNQREDITLIAALRDSNIPKFLADDAVLFRGILRDLFPGVELPESSHPDLEGALKIELEEYNMQPVSAAIRKCIQLFETMCVRWGVMLVGPTGGGKSVTLHALARAFIRLFRDGVQNPQFRDVIIQTLNPKSVTMDELYGYVNSMTFEWQDGLLGLAVRTATTNENEVHQWIVCDGPVDAVWIENMNTVLDDNKMLCLANSERIKLTPWVHMVFEVQDLAQASPATVSRCGMVYVDPDDLGWQPLIVSWKNNIAKKISENYLEFLSELFTKYFGNLVSWANRYGVFAIHQVTSSKTLLCCELLTALIEQTKFAGMDADSAKSLIGKLFVWCVLWSIGSNFRDEAQEKFEQQLRSTVKDNAFIQLPDEKLWDCRINPQTKSWEIWNLIVEKFEYNSEDKYFDMQVPTVVTTKYSYIAELLFARKYPVMFTGETGVGKSVLAISALKRLSHGKIVPVLMNFSAQTSSSRTQDIIEAQLEKRKRTQLSAPFGKVVIVFIDDVNMPKLDTYGSQPPIELLRQFLDFKGFFDREKLFWKEILDVVLGAACAPPGGGRNPLTPRFVRHFALLCLPQPDEDTLTTIFSSILGGFLGEFSSAVRQLGEPIINACVEVYERIAKELLPTPDKSHYIFNLRDLSKCVQGVLQADSANYNTDMQMYRIFYHETTRVFHDRLINNEDKSYFINLMNEVCTKHFKKTVVKEGEILLFGDFMIFGQNRGERRYDEIKDMARLESILMDYVEDYNSSSGKTMRLILFEDAICHTVRLARLLRGDRGNGLLVGVAGMGKQSLTRLAAHVNDYKCFQIELTRSYDIIAFHDDLKVLYRVGGVDNTPIVFLFIDTQIVEEEFLEDINNILNSGEVPNLFEGDDYEKVILDTREACNEQNKDGCTREDIFKYFINRTRNNLHLVISMSPVGDAFRRRCRMFPSLVNCCTIDWFSSWPSEALFSVALGLLTDVTKKQEDRISLAHTSVYIHKTVESASLRFYKEMKRHYYTTPSSYLELLKLYKSLLQKRSNEIIGKRTRISNGLNKILQTNDIVAVMQKQLQVIVPQLEIQSAAMKELLTKIEIDTQNADLVKDSVSKDEGIAKEKAIQCQLIADDASADLQIAMPALKEAEDALKSLNKSDINEIKAFSTPPQLVQFVLEAVCILLGAKPTWASAKIIMADVNFLKKLMDFDKEHINEATQRKIKKYIDNKDFNPTKIEKVSKVAKSVSLWVIAIDKFAKVYKVVEPKIKKREAAEAELSEVMKIVRAKQQELADVEAKIQILRDNLEEKSLEFQKIQDSVDLSSARINRAGRLTSALSDEEIRWKETVQILTRELWAIPGDVLVAAACVAYLGAFSTSYRRELSQLWVKECQKYNIPSSPEFDLVTILGDAYELRSWNMAGLPRDSISVENGLYATRALRWPLMIDPQEQANRWIRNLEKSRNLQILKMTDASLTRVMENCIRQGYPMLIEDIDETINPAMRPVLQRETYVHEGRVYLKLGEMVIDYDDNFKLYMTTKLSNPHYLPEICINVTLVNFLVTESGLEDQLLADIVAIELPVMEAQRNDLVVKINTDKQQLLALEDKVLKLLFNSKGNILDDEELVETLNDAKETSLIIAARLIDTEETEKIITATREKYRTLASNGAILYFVVAGLAEIDPMYQYSLKYFSQIFCNVIQMEHEKMDLPERIAQLKADELKAIYSNISRGLFENHKIIFSFLLALAIEKQDGKVTDQEFSFLTRGPVGNFPMKVKPKSLRYTEQEWASSCFLESQFPDFVGLCDDLRNSIVIKISQQSEEIAYANQKKSNVHWSKKLSSFQKVMLIKTFKKEKFTLSMVSYVTETLGKFFTETSTTNSQLKVVYLDMSSVTPLVFVLSAGSDPMANFLKFAQDMKFMEKFYSISLGQGQGPVAENMIDKSIKFGHWVFLQNCHLATSWMSQMETIIRNITLGVVKTHPEFRLFMSSMPTKSFPINVLQNSVKVTNEPPKGIKANLLGALNDINVDWFEKHALGANWRAIVFGLCMFHAVILERRKFGPLGWNILYEFNESDRDCGLRTLEMFIKRNVAQDIPWEAISYINGEITWGGRVTDYWDLRCLKTILKTFSSERILLEDYTYSRGSFYRNPNKRNLSQYVEYVHTFPIEDDPEIFGMNQNANIVFQTKETEFVVSTLLLGQPRAAGEDQEAQAGEICLEVIQNIRSLIAQKVIKDNMFPSLSQVDENGQLPSLTIVLVQEIDRFNNSLKVIHDSMNNLSKAIKGLVVMSEALEDVFNSLMSNLVPRMWSSKSFLSIKNLPNWVADYQRRIDFIQTWQKDGSPISYWISGFFFPQSFLTGILQTHARKYILPIDALKIEFEVINKTIIQQDIFEASTKGINTTPIYGGLVSPATGIYTHGFFIEAGYYDHERGGLCDARQGELYARLPVVHFKPCLEVIEGNRYPAPTYKTQARSGVLSTTGHSTNFIVPVLLESANSPDFWILRGTALVTTVRENDS